jgi:hypothetical protein
VKAFESVAALIAVALAVSWRGAARAHRPFDGTDAVTAAAAILFWSSLCSAVWYLVAVPIAARIGLINTMVFTHLPSNLLLILIPFAPNLATAIGLLLARSALSQMDVPTRASYVMAAVTPLERSAAASITAVPKTFAWAAGSMIFRLPDDAFEL